jgi:hypothetical protein
LFLSAAVNNTNDLEAKQKVDALSDKDQDCPKKKEAHFE